MTIDELLERDGVTKSRLWNGCDPTVITVEAVLHLHLLSILLKYGR